MRHRNVGLKSMEFRASAQAGLPSKLAMHARSASLTPEILGKDEVQSQRASLANDARHPLAKVQMLRLKQVCTYTGLGRSMIYQLEHEHRFPSRVRLTERAVAWIESEVQEWLANRIAQSRSNT
jgi:prophage regulatory protein